MNFDEAVAAHVKWKTRLRMFIDGHGETLQSAAVCKDNHCDLGKWIHGEAQAYRVLPSYALLRAEHANFHRCAGDVVKRVESGDLAGAHALLESSAFTAASSKTVGAIGRMKRELGA